MIFLQFEQMSQQQLQHEIEVRRAMVTLFCEQNKPVMAYFAVGELVELCGVPYSTAKPVVIETNGFVNRALHSKTILMMEIEKRARN